jgi:hypothetical protein
VVTATQISDNVTVVARGLHSAGTTAQRFAEHAFKTDDAMPYLDDVITRHRVTGNAEATENALSWFRDFVDRCLKYHTTVNAKKTKLFCTESTILGHTVAHRTITPLQHRLDALRHYDARWRSDVSSCRSARHQRFSLLSLL